MVHVDLRSRSIGQMIEINTLVTTTLSAGLAISFEYHKYLVS